MTRKKSHSDHSSCPRIAQGVERPYPRAMSGLPNPPIWPCSGWGLPCVRHYWRTGELLPRLFNLTRRDAAGGMFSVVLSPDCTGPSLTATLSFGVRTFLPPCKSMESDRLIHFSPKSLVHLLDRSLVGQPIGSFIHWPVRVNNRL
jgi:hypothetical protein